MFNSVDNVKKEFKLIERFKNVIDKVKLRNSNKLRKLLESNSNNLDYIKEMNGEASNIKLSRVIEKK